jgi:hypothetical protein
VQVEAYAGFKGSEQPRAFFWQGKRLEVRQIKDTWHEEDLSGKRKLFFRIEASDLKSYLLSYASDLDEWFLEEESKGRLSNG